MTKRKMTYKGSNYRKRQTQPDIIQTIVVGILKAIWFLLTLPFKGMKKGKRVGLSLEDKNYIATKRLEIERLYNYTSEIELRHAVMEADKLVDFILKAKGYAGETFADRLRSAQGDMPPAIYDQVWQGHKIRNQIAHESGNINAIELQNASEKLLKATKAW